MNYSHTLDVIVMNPPSKEIEELIRQEINNIIDGKLLTYLIHEHTIKIKWNKCPHNSSYNTDVDGMYGDVAVQMHKELTLKDVLKSLNTKFNNIFSKGKSILAFRISKPLTRKIIIV